MSRYAAPPGIATILADEVGSPEPDVVRYVASLPGGPAIALSDSAAAVWRAAAAGASEAEIVTALAAAYRVPAGTITPDVRTALAALVAVGVLVVDQEA